MQGFPIKNIAERLLNLAVSFKAQKDKIKNFVAELRLNHSFFKFEQSLKALPKFKLSLRDI